MNRLAVLAVLVASMAAVSCSDGPSRGSGSSEVAFLQQANAICTQGVADLDLLLGALPAQPSAALQRDVFPQILANLRDRVAAIADLGAPARLQAAVTTYVHDAGAALDRLAIAGHPALSAGTDPLAAVNAEAIKLGLTACAGT